MKKWMAAVLLAGTMGIFCAHAAQEEKPWNILFILLDDAGWKDLGFCGNTFAETPNLDKLAARGMQFTTAYSTHAFCAPSRQSMITGQWPARTAWMQRSEVKNPDAPKSAAPFSKYGAYAWTQRKPEFTSIAQALKTKGYVTGQIGKWHFENKQIVPEGVGFDVSFGGAPHVGMVQDHFSPYKGLPGNVSAPPGEYLTDRLTDEAIQFIEQNKDGPFYLQLWHYAPHAPIMAPEEVVEKYRKKRRKLGDESLNPTYAAMLDVVDRDIGRVFQTLEKLGIADHTVVILSSDNGAEITLGSVPVTSVEPLRGRKEYTYDGGIRVPMVISWPGHTKPGSSSDLTVSGIDFYPTILDIAGVPLPTDQPVDGQSLVPLLETGDQPSLEDRPLFWYELKSRAMTHTPKAEMLLPAVTVRKNGWKLIHFFGHDPELYNLNNDPSETTNLAQSEPERRLELEKLGANWITSTGIVTPQPNPNYDPDYLIERQIKNDELPEDAKMLHEWNLADPSCGWHADCMVQTSIKNDAMRMRNRGLYPQIKKDAVDLPAGKYAVQFDVCLKTSGRMRFGWKDQGRKAVHAVELFPVRDGKWQTLTAVFEAQRPIEDLRFAAPTHLKEIGCYDPKIHTDYVEIKAIRLMELP